MTQQSSVTVTSLMGSGAHFSPQHASHDSLQASPQASQQDAAEQLASANASTAGADHGVVTNEINSIANVNMADPFSMSS